MTRPKKVQLIFALVMVAVLMLPSMAMAADGPSGPPYADRGGGPGRPGVGLAATGPSVPPPIAITGPRLKPPAIPHSSVLLPGATLNEVPAPSLEANAADGGRTQEKPGRGVRQTITGIGAGLTLYDSPNVCNNFDPIAGWAAFNVKSDIWSDWFMGWAPFAIDNGYYQAKNTTFSMERVVGPGDNYKEGAEASVKIGSNQPYAGGFGSPIIPVPANFEGGQVQVSVKYLIWDHDQYGKEGGPDGNDYDWASMGIKAGAFSDSATYVNGYIRGEWAELTNIVPLGDAKDVMVLIQGQSPGALNSNIYFDDVAIAFIKPNGEGRWLKDCTLAETVK